ncbi:uridine kinase [Sporobacter termitidis DSM 10068]|uniref:Uridine kinase n=1 Tax=Sporobacter termitidis DSM 10068 TaxID=1123282 RepID=A0A1M5Z4K6_9FIRM|nr:nucleoside kinase [Sporobacter termitidis]SHI19064.1 uridine kinase [Sporobacter termitidis DSM 10068]
MTYDLSVINHRLSETPGDYVQESEKYFNSRVRKAADEIFNNIDQSPIVLLSGPSGSGKTTTAKKLALELKSLGINAYNVSLDNYFVTVDPVTAPRTPAGEIDYESPSCLDMTLLNSHFQRLAAGEAIDIPHFNFSQQARDSDRATPMKLGKSDIAVFEGIHALNECITHEHPAAYKIYVSTLTDITDGGEVLVDRASLRLVRRIVRDDYFRGADPQFTLEMWGNIRRGELLNILPYKDSANMTIDAALPYEISVMKQFTGGVFDKIQPDAGHYEVLQQVLDAFGRFETTDPALVPADSILREFIGGSSFEY